MFLYARANARWSERAMYFISRRVEKYGTSYFCENAHELYNAAFAVALEVIQWRSRRVCLSNLIAVGWGGGRGGGGVRNLVELKFRREPFVVTFCCHCFLTQRKLSHFDYVPFSQHRSFHSKVDSKIMQHFVEFIHGTKFNQLFFAYVTRNLLKQWVDGFLFCFFFLYFYFWLFSQWPSFNFSCGNLFLKTVLRSQTRLSLWEF